MLLSAPVAGVACAGIALLAGWIAASRMLWYQTDDFYCFHAAGQFVTLGLNPYDESLWRAATRGPNLDPRGFLAIPPCGDRFPYPYWTALALAPFGALPLEVAATSWMALAIVAALGGALLAWRAADGAWHGLPLFAALVLFAQPFWSLFVSGQTSGVMLGLVGALAFAVARRRGSLAGASLASLALKPQLGIAVVPVVVLSALARRERRLLLTALATAAAMALVSLAVAPGWPGEWSSDIVTNRLAEAAHRPSVWGFAQVTLGQPAYGALILGAVVAAIAIIARGRALAPVPLVALAVAISLVTTPYISSYDHLVLALPWGVTVALAIRAPGSARGLLLVAAVACASLLPWLFFAVSMTGGSATWAVVVPLAASLLLATALRVAPRRA